MGASFRNPIPVCGEGSRVAIKIGYFSPFDIKVKHLKLYCIGVAIKVVK